MCKRASGELSSLLCDDLEGWDGGGERRNKQEKGAAADEIVSITNSMDVNLSKLWEIVEDRGASHAAVDGVTKSQTQLK